MSSLLRCPAGPNNLALSRFYMRSFARAIEEGQHAVKIDPKKLLYRSNVAFHEMYSGRLDDAIRDAGEAIELNPARPKPHLAIALSQFVPGEDSRRRGRIPSLHRNRDAAGAGEIANSHDHRQGKPGRNPGGNFHVDLG
jgi:tetratricopeptide (TPR) repeat protein